MISLNIFSITNFTQQIAELNAALEELEEEKGRDLLALQTQV